jgi:Arc/MetJ-type ribon-helix-helix transcriptional regulator
MEPPTMNIPLKKRYVDWIAEQVRAGRYTSEIEAIEEAVADKIENDEYERLRARIAESERQIERGEFVRADDAFFERKRRLIHDRSVKPDR